MKFYSKSSLEPTNGSDASNAVDDVAYAVVVAAVAVDGGTRSVL